MAHNAQLSDTTANAMANAVAPLANNGFIRIYTTPQPANANTAVSTQTLLSTLRFNATAFAAAVAGLLTANAITSDTNAAATGTAVWFRCLESDGTTVLFDGSVGTSGADMNLNSVAISAGAEVDCTSFTFQAKEA